MNATVAGGGCCCCDILNDEMGMELLTDPNPTETGFGDATCAAGEADTLAKMLILVMRVPKEAIIARIRAPHFQKL
ncbi:hypothetical protein ACFX1Z_037318 [Malus domestica]